MKPKEALALVLDQVDYTNGACHTSEMVAAVLPSGVVAIAQSAADAEPDDPCSNSLRAVLAKVDYTTNRCGLTAPIGAALDRSLILDARIAMANAQ